MGTKNSVTMFQHICLVNLVDQYKLLLFELLFLFVVSQKKITKLSSWELFWFCESHLQWLLFLSIGQSLSNYHTAGSTQASLCFHVTSLGRRSGFLQQAYSVLCELHQRLSHSPPFHTSVHLPLLSQRKSCLCSFPRLTLLSVLKILIPPYHQKT